jgi:type IX secretion system PorP/SprF family membrane protein
MAQDPHFSQYFTSPMTVNPALTGSGVIDWRAAINYRSQWWGGFTAPYTTTTASIEKNLAAEAPSYFALGGYLLSDASNNGLLKNTYLSVNTAYHIALTGNGEEQLSVGLSATFANRLLDVNRFSFQSQFGNMGFQRSAPSGEAINTLSTKYFDVNGGVHFSKQTDSWGYHAGIAVFHAGTPTESIYQNKQYKISRRYTLSGGMYFTSANDNIFSVGTIYDKQGTSDILSIGAQYKLMIGGNNSMSLNLGLWNRFNDAIYPYIGLEGKNWLAGFSYDIVTSKFNANSTSVQSIEFSIAFSFGKAAKSSSQTGVGFWY